MFKLDQTAKININAVKVFTGTQVFPAWFSVLDRVSVGHFGPEDAKIYRLQRDIDLKEYIVYDIQLELAGGKNWLFVKFPRSISIYDGFIVDGGLVMHRI